MNNIEKIILSIIIARLDGDKISDKSYVKDIKKLVKDGIGGFVLFGGQFEEIKNFISLIQSISSTTLIIASDIEKGVGQQLRGGTIIPSQMGINAGFDLGKDENELKNLYSIVANEALNLGINLALVPVLDVNTEKENPIICTRAFSDDPDVVLEYGKFVIKTFKSYGLATCGKHFPGHGSTKIDSHLNLPLVIDDINIHLKPFKEAIKTGIPTIMVGHLLISQIDTKPSTLSEKVINKLLRKDLGFKGLILTDAMNMKALKDYSFPHALALKAGADIILHPDDSFSAMKEIVNAYKKGLINDLIIKNALKRVNNFRRKLTNKIHAPRHLNNKLFSIKNVFKKTITVIKNELKELQSMKIIPYLSGNYDEHIKRLFENHFSCVYDLEEYSGKDAIPLIALFTNIKAAGREYTLTNYQKNIINNIIQNKASIIVSFGNPYVITNLYIRKAKTVVLVYDSNEFAVNAFLDLFSEGLKSSGRVPIKIETNYE